MAGALGDGGASGVRRIPSPLEGKDVLCDEPDAERSERSQDGGAESARGGPRGWRAHGAFPRSVRVEGPREDTVVAARVADEVKRALWRVEAACGQAEREYELCCIRRPVGRCGK